MVERSGAVLESPSLVRLWLFTALVWGLVVPAVGTLISFQMHSPDLLPREAWLSAGRLLPIHTNGIVFGVIGTIAFGLSFYLVPRLTGVPMAWGGLGWLTCLLWNVALLGGFALLALDGYRNVPGVALPQTPGMDWLFGGNQGWEGGEFPPGIDILITLCLLLTTVQVLITLRRRQEPLLHPSLWFVLAGLIWTTLSFGLGNLLVPNLFDGMRAVTLQAMSASYLVGLWVVPMGLAGLFYFLPQLADGPLFSLWQARIVFWMLALFQPLAGLVSLVFSPLPEWQETVTIAAGVCMLIPVWGVVCNVFGTLWGRWAAMRDSTALKFLVLGTFFYLLAGLMSATLGLRGMQKLLQFTPYADAVWTAMTLGAGLFWAIGAAYAAWETTAHRSVAMEGLANGHFWLTLGGVGLLLLALGVTGILQGSMTRYGADFADMLAAGRWGWYLRTGAGAAIVLGMTFFFFNLLLTTRQAED